MRLVSTFIMIFCLLPVESFPQGEKKSGKTILCSFYPMYIATLNVAGNVPGVTIENLASPQAGCLHDYQLTPKDMKKIIAASILVVNGGGMESFIDKVIRQSPNLKIIDASKGIEMIGVQHGHAKHSHVRDHEGASHNEEECSHGDHPDDGELNAHVWVSVSGAIAQVKNIRDGLIENDPFNEKYYTHNARRYIDKLEILKKKMHESLEGIKTRDIITFHEAFPYFAREFGLNVVAVVQREPGSQPGAGEIAATIRIIRDKKVKVLFVEPQYSSKAAATIAQETGSMVHVLDPAATGPFDPDAYIHIMEANLLVLKSALGGK